ncbi:MAG TPA: diguanylate cyclase [Candidatus Acidoferrales bacterium]|nr:diguanylate cyclase [Candidatus Acidoferrales bacterium]
MPGSRPKHLAGPDASGAENLLELQAAALEAAANPIIITRRDGTILWVNKAFEQLSGYARDEAIGQSTRLLRSGQQSPSFYKEMWETVLSGKKWRGELVNQRKDGSLYPEEMTITPVMNRKGEITHFIAIKLDITKRKQVEEQFRHLALTDSLTGLANYRRLREVLDSEIKRYARTSRPFSILLLDLDELKKINDTHGHVVGSRALVRVANLLRSQLRELDTPARFGGDEFVVVLPETACKGAQKVASRISERLRDDAMQPRLSVSSGTAAFPQDGKTIDELLAAADRSLYREKRASKKPASRTRGGYPGE